MNIPSKLRPRPVRTRRSLTITSLALTATVLLVAGCRPGEEGTRVAGWSLVDPTQRHPIMISQQPSTISVRVARGSYGLSPHQRAQIIAFLDKYRTVDAGNSRLVIEAPSWSSNEVAAMQAIAEIRSLMTESGFDASSVSVESYPSSTGSQPPIRVSYLRYVAEGPECGRWPTNLASTPANVNYPNLGCATQANFAAMIANPADLVKPRSATPSSAERSDAVWDKYVKGESTVSSKKQDERVQVKGN
jgi:pilus assembly protein CpaD